MEGELVGMTAEKKSRLELRLEQELEEGRMKNNGNLDDDDLLVKAFDLVEVYFRLYRLNKLNALLAEIKPFCFQRGDDEDWIPKWLQAQATNLCKQNRYAESLPLFTEMAERLAPTSALMSNVGNVYLALGDLEKAHDHYEKAYQMLFTEPHGPDKEAGALAEIAFVKLKIAEIEPLEGDSGRKTMYLDDAKRHIVQSVEKYRDIGYVTHSMLGKALGSLAKICYARGEYEEADRAWIEAMNIYNIRMGNHSLYVAGALKERVKVIIKLDLQRAKQEAPRMLLLALDKYVLRQDVLDLKEINEILSLLLHDDLPFTSKDSAPIALKDFMPIIVHCHKVLNNEIPSQTSEHPRIDVRFLAEFYQHSGHLMWLSGQDKVTAKDWVQRSIKLWGGPPVGTQEF
uniref:Uncharacterized protein n=1 Tax=Amorphochlora amoebiformis TaxID=1561963 RepID=A0A6T6V364_9EUKA